MTSTIFRGRIVWDEWKGLRRFCCPLVLFFLISLSACKQPHTVTPAFYYWQSSLKLSQSETKYLDALHCNTLFVKFLDIGIDPETGAVAPLSMLELSDTSGLAGKSLTPCVFITNNVFSRIGPDRLDWLAQKTAEALESVGGQFQQQPSGAVIAQAVQFDCDWTASTQAAYFAFLQKIRAFLPAGTELSATIRLHQYKYPAQTGVPPVDRGALMFYNVGDIDDPAETNSIFSIEKARPYLNGTTRPYALPLDLALPVFSWVLNYRDSTLWKIIPDVQKSTFSDTSLFQSLSQTSFSVKKGTFLAGYYLRPGDQIRVEEISPELLGQVAELAAQIDLARDTRVIFFHLNETVSQQYAPKTLDSVWQLLR